MSRPVALITGASSGIGTELARVYARRGHDLIVTARREDRLSAVAEELRGHGARVETVAADLAAGKGPQKLFAATEALAMPVATLVNNAGMALSGPFADMSRAQLATLLNLNVRALTELTSLYLPGMLERRRGRILNVASVASFQAVPSLAAYSASKAYVLSLTESLSEELRGTGVTVTALCPGPTRTEMVDDIPAMEAAQWFLADARSVAEEGYRAAESGEVIRVPGPMNQAMVNWMSAQPRWLTRFFSGLAARTSFTMTPRDR